MLSVTSFLTIIWGLNKGFDFQDGGFYLLRYQKNQPFYPGIIFEHILIQKFLPDKFLNILSLRYLSLILNIFGTAFFSFGLYRYLQLELKIKSSYFKLLLFNFSFLIISYAHSPSDLSYNSLNAFVFFISVGLFLLGYCYKRPFIFLMFAGLIISFSVLIKISAGILAILIFSVMIILLFNNVYKNVFGFIGGVAFTLSFISIFIQPNFFTYFYDGYILLVKGESVYNENLLLNTTIETLYQLTKLFIISLFISIMLIFFQKSKKVIYKYGSLAILTIILYYSYDRYIERMIFMGYFSAHLFILVIFSIGAYFLIKSILDKKSITHIYKEIKTKYKNLLILLFLFILPFVGAFGHAGSSGLMSASRLYFIFFGGLLFIIYKLLMKDIIKWIYVFLSFFLLFMGTYSYVHYPYRLLPLYLQNVDFKGIKYDNETATFLRIVEEKLIENKFKKEQGIIAAYTMPGLIYLMDSFSPGGILWSQISEDLYFENLKNTELQLLPFIFVNNDELNAKFIYKLEKNSRINFHKQYSKICEIEYPNHDIFYGLQEKFSIYAPIEQINN